MKNKSFNIRVLLNHSLFKSSVLYTVTDAINKAVPFLLLPLLTHYLLPAEYGIVSNYNIYIYILSIFVGLNLAGVVGVNYYKIGKEELAELMFNVLLLILISFCICMIGVWAFQSPIQTFLPIPFLYIISATAIALGQSITAINLVFWQLEDHPFYFGIYQILQTLLNLVLTIVFLVVFKWGWEGRIYAIGIATIIFGVFSLGLLHRRGYLKVKFRKAYLVEALKFGIPLLPHTLSIWIRSAIDRILLTKYYGVEVAGIYATGFQFGLLVSFLTMAFNNAYTPYLYRNLSVEDAGQLYQKKKQIVTFTYLYLLGLIVVAIIFTLFSNLIVTYFLDPKYGSSKRFIAWAIFAQMFQGMYLMFVCFIFYIKKTSLLAWITFSCSLVQVAFSYVFIQRYGPIGAAYSTIMVSFLNFVAVWIYSNKVYHMPWNIFIRQDG
jgi:O-antigen/teichoic acid export membrane protein